MTGKDIVEQAAGGTCPLGRFTSASSASPSAPAPAPALAQGVPREQWPANIIAISQLATVADRGIGDVVKRLWADGSIYQRMQAAGVIVGQRGTPDTLNAVYAMLVGKPCRCPEVQAMMNARYPLPVTVTTKPALHPCPRCGQPMQGGCRRSCPTCGYTEGCGGPAI